MKRLRRKCMPTNLNKNIIKKVKKENSKKELQRFESEGC